MLKSYREPKLDSRFLLTDDPKRVSGHNGEDFFKVIWNRGGRVSLCLNGLEMTLEEDQIICLTPLPQIIFTNSTGRCHILQFNRQFYCIHENDREVSCEGLLFFGSSRLPVITVPVREHSRFDALFEIFEDELDTRDNIQGEMLRMLLKRLIIKSTRLARQQHFPDEMENEQADLVRRFNILVEQYFRKKHKVGEYARMLHKSPKTLANVFAAAGHKTPLEVIHHRIALEGKHQLLKTSKMAKEIAYELGFEDQSHFSRFFKKETGMYPTAYRAKSKNEELGKY